MRRLVLAFTLCVAACLLLLGLDRLPSTGKDLSAGRAEPGVAGSRIRSADHLAHALAKPTLTSGQGRAAPRLKPSLEINAGTRPKSFRGEIQEQIEAVEPVIVECLRLHRGEQGVDGKAVLTLIVAPDSSGELIIEATGVDFDQSRLDNPSLLGCLRRTGQAMVFDAIPAGVDAVSIGRSVLIEDGTLVDHRFTEFANLRDRE